MGSVKDCMLEEMDREDQERLDKEIATLYAELLEPLMGDTENA